VLARGAVRRAARGAAGAGSAFAAWAGGTEARVNSLHGQGIRRLADGLVPEAWAEDGLVEGVRAPARRRSRSACNGIPEWQHERIPFYQRTLEAFAGACRGTRWEREGGARPARSPDVPGTA
jgi:putative glutamine amidotransferase